MATPTHKERTDNVQIPTQSAPTSAAELRLLLDAKVEAEREWEKYADVIVPSEESRHAAITVGRARNRLAAAITDDTIAALIAVAEAADAHMTAWDAMEEAVRRQVLYEEQHGQFVSGQWKAELNARQAEANATEHRTAEALHAALARLEADDE
jgi:urease accessory protein UreF